MNLKFLVVLLLQFFLLHLAIAQDGSSSAKSGSASGFTIGAGLGPTFKSFDSQIEKKWKHKEGSALTASLYYKATFASQKARFLIGGSAYLVQSQEKLGPGEIETTGQALTFGIGLEACNLIKDMFGIYGILEMPFVLKRESELKTRGISRELKGDPDWTFPLIFGAYWNATRNVKPYIAYESQLVGLLSIGVSYYFF